MVRKIVHVDMDAFFAAVEIRDAPHLAGKPVIVGGSPDGRGVVASANYIARQFKVRSAMPCSKARQLCPTAVFLPLQIEKYRAVSHIIREIFLKYTPLVEPVALDEAYLDVTHNHFNLPSATWVAKRIQHDILKATKLTASAGAGPNKMLAKLACEHKKPNGLFAITPKQAMGFLQPLPVAVILGVGPVAVRQLQALHVNTIGELRQLPLALLAQHFGKRSQWLYHAARGIDKRPVLPNRPRKSVSVETTFAEDIPERLQQQAQLEMLCQRLHQRITEKRTQTSDALGRTMVLKIRLATFHTYTRSTTPKTPINTLEDMQTLATRLLNDSGLFGQSIRLIGLGLQLPQIPKPPTQQASAQLHFDWLSI